LNEILNWLSEKGLISVVTQNTHRYIYNIHTSEYRPYVGRKIIVESLLKTLPRFRKSGNSFLKNQYFEVITLIFKEGIPTFKNENEKDAITSIGVFPNTFFFMHMAYKIYRSYLRI